MSKITDYDSVIQWAKTTRESKGEKFTVLTKGEQYLIADVIYTLNMINTTLPDPQGKDEVLPSEPAPENVEQNDPVSSDVEVEPTDVDVLADSTEQADTEKETTETVAGDAAQVESENETEKEDCKEEEIEACKEEATPQDNASVEHIEQTRMEYYHSHKTPVQSVYDEFEKYCRNHPNEKKIIDFSSGTSSTAAAFAFWLGGKHSAEDKTAIRSKSRNLLDDWDR